MVVEQNANGPPSHFVMRQQDCGERWDHIGGKILVVEADHRYILGNPQASALDGVVGANGHAIVEQKMAVGEYCLSKSLSVSLRPPLRSTRRSGSVRHPQGHPMWSTPGGILFCAREPSRSSLLLSGEQSGDGRPSIGLPWPRARQRHHRAQRKDVVDACRNN